MEKNLLLSESQALRNQCQITVAEKDRQIAELQRLQQDMVGQKSLPAGSSYPVKVKRWNVKWKVAVYCLKCSACFSKELPVVIL